MADRLRTVFAEPPPPDWGDRAAVIDYLVEGERPFAGTLPFEEERLRRLAGLVYDRTPDMATPDNHWLVDQGDPYPYRLDAITAPTLVLHGTEDPLFPYGHGEAPPGLGGLGGAPRPPPSRTPTSFAWRARGTRSRRAPCGTSSSRPSSGTPPPPEWPVVPRLGG